MQRNGWILMYSHKYDVFKDTVMANGLLIWRAGPAITLQVLQIIINESGWFCWFCQKLQNLDISGVCPISTRRRLVSKFLCGKCSFSDERVHSLNWQLKVKFLGRIKPNIITNFRVV